MSYRTLPVVAKVGIIFAVAVALGFSFAYLADRLEKRSVPKSISQLRKKIRTVDKTRLVKDQTASLDTIAQLSRELDLARKDRRNALEEVRLARDRVKLLEQTQIPDLKNRLEGQEASLRQKEKECEKLKEEVVREKANVVVQVNTVRVLEGRMRDGEAEKASLSATLNSLRVNITQQDTLIQTLNDNLNRQKALVSLNDAQLKSLQADLAKARAEAETQDEIMRRDESRIQDLSDTIASMNRQMVQLSDELKIKKAEVDDTRQQVVRAQQNSQQLQNDYDLLLQQIAQRDQERKVIEGRLTRMEALKTSAQALTDAQRLETLTQQQKVVQLESEADSYKQKLVNKEIELDAKNKEIASLRQENISLSVRLATAQKELEVRVQETAATKESAEAMKRKVETLLKKGNR